MSVLRDPLSARARAAFRFAGFFYDAPNRRLFRGESEIELNPKTKDLLEVFLANPNRLVHRQELADRLWPDVAVTDDALRFQVAELRKALDDHEETFVRTVPREGYRWEASVDAGVPAAPGRFPCWLVFEGREVAIGEGENLVGRDPRSSLWIDHPAVSRHHVRIVVCGRQATLEDLGSKNGTFLGEERVEGRRGLSHGDQIRIGPLSIGFRAVSSNGTTQTDRRA